MKSFSSNLISSFSNRVSTICNCLKITRLDGTTYRYTDYDLDLEIDGEIYDSSISFNPSSYSSALGLQIENMEIIGPVDNLGINDFDIIKNLFYGAEVWLFSINYKHLDYGKNQVLHGTIGEIELTDKTFKFELRGMSKRYVNLYSAYYGKICRARLGDSKCGVNIPTYKVSGTVNDATQVNNLPLFKYMLFSNVVCNLSNTDLKIYEIKVLDSLDNNLFANNINDITYVDGSTTWTCQGTAYNKLNIVDDNVSTFSCIKGITSSFNIKSFIIETTNNISNGRYIEIHEDPTIKINTATISLSLDGYTYTSLPIPSIATFRSGNLVRIDLGLLLSAKFSNRYKFISHDLVGIEDNYFQYGTLTWTTGLNQGIQTEVITSLSSSGYIELALPTPYNISDGDQFEVTPGCNHLLIGRDGTPYSGHCFSRYQNVINFRGEPYLPNEDVLLSGYIAIQKAREAEEDGEIILEPVDE